MSAYSAFLRLGVERDGKLIVNATVQLAAGRLLVLPTPLFEKERDVIASANFVEHFGIPAWEEVEAVNAYYRSRLFEIISQ